MRTMWEILSIEPTTDASIIKKAYRQALPNYHPETDPEGFRALREAYEAALNYQESSENSDENNSSSDEEVETPETIIQLNNLLTDPQRRFNAQAWTTWIEEVVDELSLDEFEGIQFWVLQTLLNGEYYLAHDCIRLVINRFNWQEYYEQHADEHSRRVVLSFIQNCQADNTFDFTLLNDYPFVIQDKIIEFFQTCQTQSKSSALYYLTHYLDINQALPIPNDPKLIIKIAHWYMLTNSPNILWLEALRELKANTQDEMDLKDIDYLINFHSVDETNSYIELLVDLNPHFHMNIAFHAYLQNSDIFPLIHITHFLKHHVLEKLNTQQILNFDPVVPISLPLSMISQDLLHSGVAAMIEDYWGYYSFGFVSYGLVQQPEDGIEALLYAIWTIKYGDEWSLEEFINLNYDYENEVINFLLKTLQEIAQEFLTHFKTNPAIQEAKAILNLYNAPINDSTTTWDDKNSAMVQSWLSRFHPFTQEPFATLSQHNWIVKGQYPLMQSYFTYLFALSEAHLPNLKFTNGDINLWRQQNLLVFSFTRTKNIAYLNQHRKLIKKLPKTQLKWFDQVYKMLKTVTNNRQCFKVDFFWEEIVESALKKQPQYASIFYIYHFNWRYIATSYPKKAVLEFFYMYLMTNITDHNEKTMSDADVLLAMSLLMSRYLSNDRKTSLENYLAAFRKRSPAVEENLHYYGMIVETGEIPKECETWVPPFKELLLLQHKVKSNQPFSKEDKKYLYEVAEVSDEYNTVLSMSAVVLREEGPLSSFSKMTSPIRWLYKVITKSRFLSIAFWVFLVAFIRYLLR